MSEIFEKNLKAINTYNPFLCKKLLDIKELTKDIQLVTNDNGEYNLIVDNILVHSDIGAEQEAKNIFFKLPHNSENSIHVIYGLGLGYLYDVFSENALGSIIVYEDDLEVLRFVLEVVDFTHSFKKKLTYFVSDFQEYKSLFNLVFRYKTQVSLSSLSYHLENNNESYNQFKKEVERNFSLTQHNFAFQAHTSYAFLLNTIFGLEHKILHPFLVDYPNLLNGKTAVVVSAGPSLAKNIDILKKYKDNVYIFCVGTALKTLLKNGIIPDFLHVIEKNDTTVHFNVPEVKDLILISEPYTNYKSFHLPFKKIFLTTSEETDASRWYIETTGSNPTPFETKGTVSYQALYSAKCFGCKNIILLGQDLAYSDGDCYAKGSEFEDLKCFYDEDLKRYRIYPKDFNKYMNSYYNTDKLTQEQKIERINRAIDTFNAELVTVDGQNGNKLPTSRPYALFIEYIKEFGLRFNNELNLCNSSIGGAMIEGFELMPLESALKKFASVPIDKSVINKTEHFKSNIDFEFLLNSLNNDNDFLKNILPLLEKGQLIVEKLNKELKNKRICSDKAEKYLELAADLYVNLTNNFTNLNRVAKICAMKENYELSYLMKQFKSSNNMNIEFAVSFAEAFTNYFNELHKKMSRVVNHLAIVIERLEGNKCEISNSKS